MLRYTGMFIFTSYLILFFFFFQAEDGIRDLTVTGVQTCALPISDWPLSKENIYVLEKAREVGQHCLSGALLDPRSMRELLPGFEKEAPIDAEVSKEGVYFLTEKGKFKFPITPPPLRDHGNYVVSLNRFTKWMGSKVEET